MASPTRTLASALAYFLLLILSTSVVLAMGGGSSNPSQPFDEHAHRKAHSLSQIFRHQGVDKRCKCHCKEDPQLGVAPSIYILSDKEILQTANDCNCLNAVIPTLKKEKNLDIDDIEIEGNYCKLCGCMFEIRDTDLIRFSINCYIGIILSVIFYGVLVKFELVDTILMKILPEKYHKSIPKQKLGNRVQDYLKVEEKMHKKRENQKRFLAQKLQNASNNPNLTILSSATSGGQYAHSSCFNLNSVGK